MATNGVNGHSKSALCSVQEFTEQRYDYVIVGAGTAGLCVAARLTENPDVKVGVIEAGYSIRCSSRHKLWLNIVAGQTAWMTRRSIRHLYIRRSLDEMNTIGKSCNTASRCCVKPSLLFVGDMC